MNTAGQLSISDARINLPNLVDSVSKYLNRVVITVNGIPKATLVSPEELESLEETAEILAIPGAKARIKRGAEQIARGEFVRLSDLQ